MDAYQRYISFSYYEIYNESLITDLFCLIQCHFFQPARLHRKIMIGMIGTSSLKLSNYHLPLYFCLLLSQNKKIQKLSRFFIIHKILERFWPVRVEFRISQSFLCKICTNVFRYTLITTKFILSKS